MARPPKVINEFRGVNKLDRFSIGEKYAMSTKNLTSDKFPALTTRPGQTILGAAVGTKCLGLGVWKDTELIGAFNDGTIRKWTGSAWSSALKSGLSTTAEWTFTNFKGGLTGINLFGTNGVDAMIRYDGATITDVAGAPAGSNYVTQFADRLWAATGNELHATAYRDGTDWTTTSVPEEDTDSWFTIVETLDGETINGIRAGLTKMVITKPSSIHELYGYAPSDYEVRPVTFDIGAFNNRCTVMLNGVMYLLDSNGIHKYTGGSLPNKQFSVRVQDYIDNINQTAKGKSCIGTDGLKLYISIPVSSSTAPDTILVYDPKHDTWFVWDNFSALQFAQVGAIFYFGDNAGKVHQLTGTTDNGAAISWEYVLAPITAPSYAQLIRWFTAWVTAYVGASSSFDVYLSKLDSGDTDWTLIKSLSASAVVESTPIYLSANTQAQNAKYLRPKFSGTGPVDLREFTREEEYSPLK
jgi:hypothetical protein